MAVVSRPMQSVLESMTMMVALPGQLKFCHNAKGF